jgi:hypothetical protein
MRLSSTELPNTGIKQVMSLPSVQLSRLNGTAENLLDSTGTVLLVVNGASQCGFALQYKDLAALYHRHMGTFSPSESGGARRLWYRGLDSQVPRA